MKNDNWLLYYLNHTTRTSESEMLWRHWLEVARNKRKEQPFREESSNNKGVFLLLKLGYIRATAKELKRILRSAKHSTISLQIKSYQCPTLFRGSFVSGDSKGQSVIHSIITYTAWGVLRINISKNFHLVQRLADINLFTDNDQNSTLQRHHAAGPLESIFVKKRSNVCVFRMQICHISRLSLDDLFQPT